MLLFSNQLMLGEVRWGEGGVAFLFNLEEKKLLWIPSHHGGSCDLHFPIEIPQVILVSVFALMVVVCVCPGERDGRRGG